MKYTKVKLTNGSTLGLINLPGVYTATISAFLKAGFKYDASNKPGLAHFTEHMLFDGTKDYPTPMQLAWAVEKFGGWQYAYTWIEHQQHTIHLPKDNFEAGISILMDKLINPLLNNKEFEREKGMVKEEILRNRSDHEKAILDYAWQPLFFQGTNIARPYSGVEKDIESLSIKDIKGFIDHTFLPDSTVFLVASGIDSNSIVETFERYTKGYNKKGILLDDINLVSNGLDRVMVYPCETEQVSIAFGVRAVGFNDNKKFKLDLIKDILGGFYGARLPQKLRDGGGLIYNWNIWQDNFSDTGYLLFKSSTAIKNINKMIKIVLAEFDRLTKQLISKEELEVAKGHIIGSLFCNTQTGFDYVNWYGMQELLSQKSISLAEQAKIYAGITAEEILDIAKMYFCRENIYLAVAGNVDTEELNNLLIE